MLQNNYLSVMLFQLRLKIKCDSTHDYLEVDDEYVEQIEKSIQHICEFKPDIAIFPEMSYHSEYDETFKQLSGDNKLIVFGSTYIGNINYTMAFHNGNLTPVQKIFPCGSEPMVRFIPKITTQDFLRKHLHSHEFWVKDKKVYILNCLEYYEAAYFIARNPKLSEDLFAFVSPCSNSNPKVFMDESRALHNHNEFVYSFVCNRIKDDGTKGYGRSYIYGPIQYHEKDWLKEEGIISDDHNASILTLDGSTPSFAYGMFACGKSLSRFGRSDCYLNTPKNVCVKNLI